MQELETLLNTLLKMGWEPYSQSKFKKIKVSSNIYNEEKRRIIVEFDGGDFGNYYKLCDVASINSGLWQFCEKNGLLHEYYNGRSNIHPYKCYWTTTYQYRLLESALIPEEELVKFLLDNIKVEGKKE